MNKIVFISLLLITSFASANQNILNIYIWGNYLPNKIIHQFTKETGIRVNLTEYDNNETMYAKLKASSHIGYDIVMPSSYYVSRMIKQRMLYKLDKNKLLNFKNLNPSLLYKEFDPNNDYSIPYFWGTTGIIINTDYFASGTITHWRDLWQPQYKNQLMMLDDMREVFAVAFLTLGYSINDSDPEHIKQAYLKLKQLLPNIKTFNIDAVPSIYIDEDATIGMIWSGDCKLANDENNHLQYVYPQEGFPVWIDSMAILSNAPHKEEAYKFIDFILRPEIAAEISNTAGYSTPNLPAVKLLPKNMQDSLIVNPDSKTMKRAKFQTDVDEKTRKLYEQYWEMLKTGE